jgi:hypothetical protein
MDTAPALGTIRINGHLGATVLMAFPALASLTEVEARGLDLLEVRQLTPDCKSQGLGDNRSP